MDTQTEPLRIAVVVGSTRPGRRSAQVAQWVLDGSAACAGATFDLVDLADHPLPLLDEPIPAIAGIYQHDHTRAWSERIASFDGYVFVVPEYNHSIPGVLKNAIDFLYDEWRDKAAGIVSYGADAGGARAAEHLRMVLAELHVATVRAHVPISLRDDLDADGGLAPRDRHLDNLPLLLDQVVRWSGALRDLRTAEPVG